MDSEEKRIQLHAPQANNQVANLAALEQASTYGNIEPFADLIVRLLVEQAVRRVERGRQREAND